MQKLEQRITGGNVSAARALQSPSNSLQDTPLAAFFTAELSPSGAPPGFDGAHAKAAMSAVPSEASSSARKRRKSSTPARHDGARARGAASGGGGGAGSLATPVPKLAQGGGLYGAPAKGGSTMGGGRSGGMMDGLPGLLGQERQQERQQDSFTPEQVRLELHRRQHVHSTRVASPSTARGPREHLQLSVPLPCLFIFP